MSRWSAIGVAGFAGIGAGVLLLLATLALERSRIAFGPFALYGNGALIVPAAGGPVALFAGWTTLERLRSVDPWLLGAFALGVAAPLGATALVFLLPSALLTGVLWKLFRSGRLPGSWVVLATLGAIGVVAPYLAPPIGGLAAGALLVTPALVAASRRPDPSWRIAVGFALLGLLLASAFLVPLVLMAGRPA